MIRNYLAVAIRGLKRSRANSLINVIGLALGIACSLVITMWVMDELSYDRHHVKADRIYRMVLDAKLMGKEIKGPVTPFPMGPAIVEEIPEVEAAVRLWQRTDMIVTRKERVFPEKVFFADASYFDVFTHPLIEGEPSTALREPQSVVITRSAAMKLFGDLNALGETITINNEDFEVTGVAEDVPHQAHAHFEYLVSMSSRAPNREDAYWVSNNYRTYAVLSEGASPAEVEDKLNVLVRRHAAPQIQMILKVSFDEFEDNGGRYAFRLQRLTDIHLRSHYDMEIEPNGDIDYVYMFSSIAILVIAVACINYTNLTTARASRRSVEIGMRKAVGARRGQLIGQFLGESILLAFVSGVMALLLVELLLPRLSGYLGKPLTLDVFSWTQAVVGVGLILALGTVAGAYPAFLLSGVRPEAVMKGPVGFSGKGSLRGVLVVFQFVVSVVLVIGTTVVAKQVQYVQNKHLGFDKDHLIVLHRAWPIRSKFAAFREELERDPRIQSVAGSSDIPGQWFNNSAFLPEGSSGGQTYLLWRLCIDEAFVETMGMNVVEGRTFSRDFASDSSAALLNRAAADLLGWENPIGKRLRHPGRVGGEFVTYEVIGVLEDFQFESLREEVRPLIVQHVRHPETNNMNNVVIRFRTDDVPALLEKVEATWAAMRPDQPFLFSFLNDDLDALYAADRKIAGIAASFSALAIVIGCLGLFGLALFTAEHRRKEIGIRKTLGASVGSVVGMLSADVIKYVVVGNVVAWPIAYYVMDHWLQDFAFRTSIGVLPFLAAGGLAMLVALGTVSVQTIKAARANPVDALKYE